MVDRGALCDFMTSRLYRVTRSHKELQPLTTVGVTQRLENNTRDTLSFSECATFLVHVCFTLWELELLNGQIKFFLKPSEKEDSQRAPVSSIFTITKRIFTLLLVESLGLRAS